MRGWIVGFTYSRGKTVPVRIKSLLKVFCVKPLMRKKLQFSGRRSKSALARMLLMSSLIQLNLNTEAFL
jgi:hypothetical protein